MKDLQFTRAFSKNSANKLLGLFLLFFLYSQTFFAADVVGRPRKMSLIKTEHFDIIFSNETEKTALLLVQNADSIYEKAAENSGLKINLHMPVIISPDSDEFTVDYTPSPYNRIIIFDAPSDYETAVFEDILFSMFYREVYSALAQSVRSRYNQFVAKWIAGDAYKPVELFNLPYSFIEGRAYLAESEKPEEGRLNDGYFLQILSQAKLEGKFPKWEQISTVRDIYPGDELTLAAGAGFSAFLMNTYGIEKYAELWQQSGKINPLLTHGVFKKTYDMSVSELWKQFEASVPVPELVEEGEPVFPKDKEANYEHILLTEYGTVWYDRIRHEVDIYDENNVLKMRRLLFLADNVERMGLSPDGRYIAVSTTQISTKGGLSKDSVWIYDLRERKFLKVKYPLKDAAIIYTADKKYAVAGVSGRNSGAKLEIYTMPEGDVKKEEPELLYTREFERNKTPLSPVYGGDGFVTYILADGNRRYLCRFNFTGDEIEQKWQITSATEPLKIQRLNWNSSRRGSARMYTFSFALPQSHSFTRTGFIRLNERFEPQSVQLTTADVSGGVNFPVASSSGYLYYSARFFAVNQLRKVAPGALDLEEGRLVATGSGSGDHGKSDAYGQPGDFSDYTIYRYNPLKYMADFKIMPFFPLKVLDLKEGNLYWPGLGLTIESQTDPCMNTKALLSAGWTYMPMDFSWTEGSPSRNMAKIRKESQNISKDKSVAFYIENSSTPVHMKGGTLFNCNRDGEYTFKALAGGQLKLPVGIALRNLIIDLSANYTASTDYYDQTQEGIFTSLSDWPSFNNAYEIFELSAQVEYTNIHQYGYSSFEQRGLLIGLRAYTMWDFFTDNTQINVGLFGDVAIPRLTPLTSDSGWVLSVPAQISAEFMNKTGTALEARSQVLLIGHEFHNNVLTSLLYARRAGLWLGYDMGLVYDTSKVRLPDIRHQNYLAEIFTDVSYTYAVYMILNLDWNLIAGKLSSVPINTTLTGTWFPESHGYNITLDVRFQF